MSVWEQGQKLLLNNTHVYSSDYLEQVSNEYLSMYTNVSNKDNKIHIDSVPTTMFSAEISNRMSFSSILNIIELPINALLSELRKEIDDYNQIFLLGSRAFNYNYLLDVKGGLEKVSIQKGNYDILHVTNKSLYKGRLMESIVPKFVELQVKLHREYRIPTVLRLINNGGKKLRDELCLYPGCTGIMLDMVGWNSDNEISNLDSQDKLGILSDESQFESLVFLNSILVDNPKRFSEILHQTSPLPKLNKLGVNLFFRIVGERMYKSFPVDTFRKQILDRQVTNKVGYSTKIFELYNALLFNVNVPGYQKKKLLRNIVDVIEPNLVDSYVESVVDFFRGYVNYMTSRIHTKFETKLKDKAFIILTGGDAFKRYESKSTASQDYDYKVVCQASGKKGQGFYKLPGSGKDLVTECYEVITDELTNFMSSMNKLIELKKVNIEPIVKRISNIDTYMSIRIYSTFYNPNVVNFRMRKGDKNKTRIYSVDFRTYVIFEYSRDGVNISEVINLDIPLIDIGIIDAYDFDSTKTIEELKVLHQHSSGPVASPYFLLADLYKTYTTPSMYKSRYNKLSKDKKRIEKLIGSISRLPMYKTLDLSNIVYNKSLDIVDVYTLPAEGYVKYYKNNVVFDNTFKKTFEKKEWDKSWKKDNWVNDILLQSKQQFNNWSSWEKIRTPTKVITKVEENDVEDINEVPYTSSDIQLDLSSLSISTPTTKPKYKPSEFKPKPSEFKPIPSEFKPIPSEFRPIKKQSEFKAIKNYKLNEFKHASVDSLLDKFHSQLVIRSDKKKRKKSPY
jgi:hypothetical protein